MDNDKVEQNTIPLYKNHIEQKLSEIGAKVADAIALSEEATAKQATAYDALVLAQIDLSELYLYVGEPQKEESDQA